MSAHPFQYAGVRASVASIQPGALGPESHTIPLNLIALIISFVRLLCSASCGLLKTSIPNGS